MRLAITGATGFVGQAVLDEFLSSSSEAIGHIEVRALTRRAQAPSDGVEWVSGSLSDTASLNTLVDGVDAVIHIAGLTNTPDPANFEAANVIGTANVIAAMKKAKCKRLVFVSSLSARKPELSAYGASKAAAEELVQGSGLSWTVVRPPAVYGPRDDDMLELFKTAKWGLVPLPPGGATSIIYVSDLAKLLFTLAAASGHKKLYEPDDGREGGWAHQEMAQAIGKAVGKRSVFAPHLPAGVLSAAAGALKLIQGDKAKLTADRVGYMCHPNWVVRSDRKPPETLWKADVSGEEGFAKTAKWYRDAGWL
ncbi:MAG: NAD(P)-dependent oxidoreductase [Erythrobacter sp.]